MNDFTSPFLEHDAGAESVTSAPAPASGLDARSVRDGPAQLDRTVRLRPRNRLHHQHHVLHQREHRGCFICKYNV